MSGANSRPDAGFLDEIDDPVGVAPIHGTKIGKRTIDLSDEDRFRLARAILASPDPLAPQHTVSQDECYRAGALGPIPRTALPPRGRRYAVALPRTFASRGLLRGALDDDRPAYSNAADPLHRYADDAC
jgi:hypothetical protein